MISRNNMIMNVLNFLREQFNEHIASHYTANSASPASRSSLGSDTYGSNRTSPTNSGERSEHELEELTEEPSTSKGIKKKQVRLISLVKRY